MKLILGLALLATTVLIPLGAGSTGDCDSKGTPALGVVDFQDGYYWDDRNYFLGNGWWFYQESNGDPGLQRGGSSPIVPNDSEICSDDDPAGPDTLMW